MTSWQSCPVISEWCIHTKTRLLQPAASPTGTKPNSLLKRTLYVNTKGKKIAMKMLLKCLIQECCLQLLFQCFRKKSTYLKLSIFNHLIHTYIYRYRFTTSQGKFNWIFEKGFSPRGWLGTEQAPQGRAHSTKPDTAQGGFGQCSQDMVEFLGCPVWNQELDWSSLCIPSNSGHSMVLSARHPTKADCLSKC